MQIDVSIIIVNWNTRDMTLACIESIRRETNKTNYELLIIDNNSSDGSAAAIANAAPEARLLAQRENLGFAGASNLAAMQARGRYILLLHADTIITDAAIDRLVSFAGCMPEARIWGGRSRFADGTLNPASCAARMTPWNQFCHAVGLSKTFENSALFNAEAYGGWLRDSVRRVDIVASSFMLVDTQLWRQLNGFDLTLFMYGEDADFCLRAEKLGATPFISPSAEIIHHGGISETSRPGQLIKLLTARATLIRKHWPVGTHWLGRRLLEAWSLGHLIKARMLNRLNPCHDYNHAAEAWAQIIAARKTWRQGYNTKIQARSWAVQSAMRENNSVPLLKAG